MLGKTDTGTPPGLELREQLVIASSTIPASRGGRAGWTRRQLNAWLHHRSLTVHKTSRPRFHGCAPGAVGHETCNSSWSIPRRPEHVTRFFVQEIRALGSREPFWERSNSEDTSADLDASHDRGGSLRLIYHDVGATRYQPEAGPGGGHKIDSQH